MSDQLFTVKIGKIHGDGSKEEFFEILVEHYDASIVWKVTGQMIDISQWEILSVEVSDG